MAGNCQQCSLNGNPVPGSGNLQAPLFMIGEAPGFVETIKRMPFVGKSGEELFQGYLFRAGISRSICYVTNVLKCRPSEDATPTDEQIAACMPQLQSELDAMNPKAIVVTLGAVALRVLMPNLRLDVVHGIPQLWNNHILVPMYHPAAGLHATSKMSMIEEDAQALRATIKGEITWDRPDPYPNPVYNLVQADNRYAASFSLATSKLIGVDTETVLQDPYYIQFSTVPGTGWVIRADDDIMLSRLRKRLSEEGVLTILHNALYDLKVLGKLNIHPRDYRDTMIMAYLLETMPQGLKALAYRLCSMQMDSYEELVYPFTQALILDYLKVAAKISWPRPPEEPQVQADGTLRFKRPRAIESKIKRTIKDIELGKVKDIGGRWSKMLGNDLVEGQLGPLPEASLADIPEVQAVYYSGRDPDATRRIYFPLLDKINQASLHEIMLDDTLAVPSLQRMRTGGLPVAREEVITLGADLQNEMDFLVAGLESTLGHAFNPGSPPQVATLLKQLRLTTSKKTRGGAMSTAKEHLEKLKGANPIFDKVLEYREIDKLKGTYVEGILRNLVAQYDGGFLLFPDLRNTKVITGRLSCNEPNLLATPKHTPRSKRIRQVFVAPDNTMFLSADYSQMELRIMAHMSHDEHMLSVFDQDLDIHAATAMKVFGLKDLSEVDPDKHRFPAKAVNYGIPYGMTERKLQEDLAERGIIWSKKVCLEFIESWKYEVFPGAGKLMDDLMRYARRYREIRDVFGRRRLIPEVLSVHFFIREAGLRQATNGPFQMGAASIIKKAMHELEPMYEIFNTSPHVCRPLLQIHDDMLSLVSTDILNLIALIKQSIMENVVTLDVPIKVDLQAGPNWGDTKTLEDLP